MQSKTIHIATSKSKSIPFPSAFSTAPDALSKSIPIIIRVYINFLAKEFFKAELAFCSVNSAFNLTMLIYGRFSSNLELFILQANIRCVFFWYLYKIQPTTYNVTFVFTSSKIEFSFNITAHRKAVQFKSLLESVQSPQSLSNSGKCPQSIPDLYLQRQTSYIWAYCRDNGQRSSKIEEIISNDEDDILLKKKEIVSFICVGSSRKTDPCAFRRFLSSIGLMTHKTCTFCLYLIVQMNVILNWTYPTLLLSDADVKKRHR